MLDRRSTVTQDIVPGEHDVFFLKDETHVVVRVAGRMHGADGGAFDGEDLPVGDGLLGSAGAIFVDGIAEVRVEAEEVGNAARVVTVPVGEQYVREGYVGGGERGGDQVGPFWQALGGVDEESFGACSDDVGVGPLECELAIRLAAWSCLVNTPIMLTFPAF